MRADWWCCSAWRWSAPASIGGRRASLRLANWPMLACSPNRRPIGRSRLAAGRADLGAGPRAAGRDWVRDRRRRSASPRRVLHRSSESGAQPHSDGGERAAPEKGRAICGTSIGRKNANSAVARRCLWNSFANTEEISSGPYPEGAPPVKGPRARDRDGIPGASFPEPFGSALRGSFRRRLHCLRIRTPRF